MKGHDDSRSRMLLQDMKYFWIVSGESCDGDAQESPASVAGIVRDSSARHIFPATMFSRHSALEAGENILPKLFQIWLNGEWQRWNSFQVAAFSQRGLRGEVTLSQEGEAVKVWKQTRNYQVGAIMVLESGLESSLLYKWHF